MVSLVERRGEEEAELIGGEVKQVKRTDRMELL